MQSSSHLLVSDQNFAASIDDAFGRAFHHQNVGVGGLVHVHRRLIPASRPEQKERHICSMLNRNNHFVESLNASFMFHPRTNSCAHIYAHTDTHTHTHTHTHTYTLTHSHTYTHTSLQNVSFVFSRCVFVCTDVRVPVDLVHAHLLVLRAERDLRDVWVASAGRLNTLVLGRGRSNRWPAVGSVYFLANLNQEVIHHFLRLAVIVRWNEV